MASTVKSRLTLAGTVDGVDKAKRSAFVVLATLGEHPTPHHARVTNSGQLRRLLTVVFDAIALLALCTLGTARGHWHDSWSWLTDLKAPHIVTGAEDAKLFHVVYVEPVHVYALHPLFIPHTVPPPRPTFTPGLAELVAWYGYWLLAAASCYGWSIVTGGFKAGPRSYARRFLSRSLWSRWLCPS